MNAEEELLKDLGLGESFRFSDEISALSFYYRQTWNKSPLRSLALDREGGTGTTNRLKAEATRAQLTRVIFCMRRLTARQQACLDANMGLGVSYARAAYLQRVLRLRGDERIWALRLDFGLDFRSSVAFPPAINQMRRWLPDDAQVIGREVREARRRVRSQLEDADLLTRGEDRSSYERAAPSARAYRRPPTPAQEAG